MRPHRLADRPAARARAPAVPRGLHCGWNGVHKAWWIRPYVPAVQRRAPLRRIPRLGTRQRPLLALPPFNGGLHCGWTNLGKGQPETLVLPPFNGGLHAATRWLDTRSSRCSRLLTAGSIAAGRRSRCRRRRATAPAVQRRAPLRYERPHGVPVLIQPAPAVQRRAPLRRAPDDLPHLVCSRCSRRSAAGSIAVMTC